MKQENKNKAKTSERVLTETINLLQNMTLSILEETSSKKQKQAFKELVEAVCSSGEYACGELDGTSSKKLIKISKKISKVLSDLSLVNPKGFDDDDYNNLLDGFVSKLGDLSTKLMEIYSEK